MKISISQRNITAAKLSKGKRTPVELAVMETDCFEEVRLRIDDTGKFRLDVDGARVKLPALVQRRLRQYHTTHEMQPFTFDLLVEGQDMFGDEELYLDAFDTGFEYGYA
ncbi:MAG: hypothetical protein OHK0039_31360 [Bacteroidia bacterium]